MRRLASLVSLVVIVFLMTGCFMLDNLVGPISTFAFTIGGEKVVVQLPKNFPDISKAIRSGEKCWNTELCATSFCLSDEAVHGYIVFFYSGNNVVVLAWYSEEGVAKWWIYLEKIPIEVDYEKAEKALDMILKGG